MKILIASKNPAKIKYYSEGLKNIGVEVINLNDINIDIDIEESGKNAVENAIIKARTYYNATNMTTIGIDDNLYIEGLSDDEQPGTHVRRIKDKRLTDKEAIDYYINIVEKLGGKVTAKWVKGIAICKDKETVTFEIAKKSFYLVTKPSKIINTGYPLDSISIIPEFNKYLTELTEEEKIKYKENDGCSIEIMNFLKENI